VEYDLPGGGCLALTNFTKESCPYRKSHPLAREANRAMLPPDVGRLQIDLVAANRVIPIESDG
jgi:hypothetical protein